MSVACQPCAIVFHWRTFIHVCNGFQTKFKRAGSTCESGYSGTRSLLLNCLDFFATGETGSTDTTVFFCTQFQLDVFKRGIKRSTCDQLNILLKSSKKKK